MTGFSEKQVEEVTKEIKCDICGEVAVYEGIYGQIGDYIVCKGCGSLICNKCLNDALTCPECGAQLFEDDS